MGVNKSEFEAWLQGMHRLQDNLPEILQEIAVGEGVYARDQARKICTQEKIVNLGDYRRNWQSDSIAKKSGKGYYVRFFNPLEYALHLEYGFRSHFVPGHWEGNTFVYQPGDSEGGMYVGPYGGRVPGHFVMKKATERTLATQQARVSRKLLAALDKRIG